MTLYLLIFLINIDKLWVSKEELQFFFLINYHYFFFEKILGLDLWVFLGLVGLRQTNFFRCSQQVVI